MLIVLITIGALFVETKATDVRIIWLGVGVVSLVVAFWQALYRERLLVDPRRLVRIRGLGPLRLRREYERAAIEDLRLEEGHTLSWVVPFANLRIPGQLAFQYGGRKIHIVDADRDEAERVLEALRAELGQA
ncbi:hypothetical protein OJ997_02490 [Solirubrobacter phytolaccae]|uniref:PH domain-containing protein n=1 Tax=Solirubrobacter phytolaccae TaxID=1404360 RepID=A0A9X3S9E5_9ACTN|nr:hypothetical protein [Solirubrobacter phytolaccae]MDA0179150.1 hypothetical protein [Solirubrobacter phytolaccae]